MISSPQPPSRCHVTGLSFSLDDCHRVYSTGHIALNNFQSSTITFYFLSPFSRNVCPRILLLTLISPCKSALGVHSDIQVATAAHRVGREIRKRIALHDRRVLASKGSILPGEIRRDLVEHSLFASGAVSKASVFPLPLSVIFSCIREGDEARQTPRQSILHRR